MRGVGDDNDSIVLDFFRFCVIFIIMRNYMLLISYSFLYIFWLCFILLRGDDFVCIRKFIFILEKNFYLYKDKEGNVVIKEKEWSIFRIFI